MPIDEIVGCQAYTCSDVLQSDCRPPEIEKDPAAISVVLISEAAPADPANGYYADGNSLFEQTTVLAFQEAGVPVNSARDLLARGVCLDAPALRGHPPPVAQARQLCSRKSSSSNWRRRAAMTSARPR